MLRIWRREATVSPGMQSGTFIFLYSFQYHTLPVSLSLLSVVLHVWLSSIQKRWQSGSPECSAQRLDCLYCFPIIHPRFCVSALSNTSIPFFLSFQLDLPSISSPKLHFSAFSYISHKFVPCNSGLRTFLQPLSSPAFLLSHLFQTITLFASFKIVHQTVQSELGRARRLTRRSMTATCKPSAGTPKKEIVEKMNQRAYQFTYHGLK